MLTTQLPAGKTMQNKRSQSCDCLEKARLNQNNQRASPYKPMQARLLAELVSILSVQSVTELRRLWKVHILATNHNLQVLSYEMCFAHLCAVSIQVVYCPGTQ